MTRQKVVMDVPMLKRVCNYAHWIPVTKGLYESFFTEHFPGWQWNDFVPALLKKNVLTFNRENALTLVSLGQHLFISPEVHTIEFIPSKKGVKIKVLAIAETSELKELEKA